MNPNNKYRSSKVHCEPFMLRAHTDPLGFLSTFRAPKSRERPVCSKSQLLFTGKKLAAYFAKGLSLWEELPVHLQVKSCLCSAPMLCRWQSLSLPLSAHLYSRQHWEGTRATAVWSDSLSQIWSGKLFDQTFPALPFHPGNTARITCSSMSKQGFHWVLMN